MKRLSLLPWLMLLLTGLLGSMPNARAGETVTLVMTDAQGTPVVETDIHGTVLARYAYRPYGTSVGGPLPAGPGYTGHVNDPDTGLVYMQQRYYDPEVGRFPSPDPVGPVPGNVFNINRYAYANNNPLRYTDPDGRAVHVGGNVADQQELIRQAGKFTGLLVTQDAKGMLQALQCTADQSSASPAAASALTNAINSPATINLTAVRADPGIFGDQYVSGKIDVADIKGFASQSPQMGGAILTHVLTEYQTAQEMPGGQVLANFQTAHQTALSAESQVFGAVNRTNSVSGPGAPLTPGSSITFDYLNGTGNVVKSYTYTLDQNGTPY